MIDFYPLPNYGDLIPLKEFKQHVKDGSFIDYDGHGNLATKNSISDIVVQPSTIKKIKIPSWVTHVCWYNR